MASDKDQDKDQVEQQKHEQNGPANPSSGQAGGTTGGGAAPKKTKKSVPPPYSSSAGDFRIPGSIGIGPITTVGQVLAARPGDPRTQPQEIMRQPTVGELHAHLSGLLKGQRDDEQVKPVFGPERPPKK